MQDYSLADQIITNFNELNYHKIAGLTVVKWINSSSKKCIDAMLFACKQGRQVNH
jgi:hypothetical protein